MIRFACWNAVHSYVSFDVITHDLRGATSGAHKIDILKVDPIARSTRTARKIRDYPAVLPTAGAGNIQKVDIGNVHFRRIFRACCFVDVEIALIKDNRSIRILDVNVLVGDVVDVSVANVWAGPSLETSTVLAIQESYVLDPRIRDVIFDAGILPDGTHRHTVGAVAP